MTTAQLTLISTPPTAALPLPDDGGRIERDAYYTPDLLTFAALAAVQEMLLAEDKRPIEGIVWEPHVGGGAWARAVLALTEASLFVSDLNPEAAGLTGWPRRDRHPYASRPGLDFLTAGFDVADWIVGNPPFKGAEAHIRQALALSRRHVVFLLRAGIFAGKKRVPLWRDHPPRHVWFLAGRPSFTACGGTDMYDYALVWWDKRRPDGTATYGWDWAAAPVGMP